MDIFSNLNLNQNTINYAKLGNWGNGNEEGAQYAGAIRYSGTSLQFHNGSTWQSVGTSTGLSSFRFENGTGATGSGATIDSDHTAIKIGISGSNLQFYTGSAYADSSGVKVPIPKTGGGPISVYTADTFGTGTSDVVPIAVGSNTTPSASYGIKIQGDTKGKITFTGSGTTYGGYSVNTDVVRVRYTDISISSQMSSSATTGLDFTIKHGLGTKNILINTYFAESKGGVQYGNFMLVQCDIELVNDNNIKVALRGLINEGVLKVVIYGGAQMPLLNDTNDSTVVQYTTSTTDTAGDQTINDGDKVTPTQKVTN